jgi:hypothetical protein
MRATFNLLLGCLLLAGAGGCGSGGKYAPVSGVVTIDGKPYGEAVVTFQPFATKDNPEPGRGSSGDTDANGKFVLKTDDLKNGAVVGKHQVRIWTRGPGVVSGYDASVGTPDGAGAPAPRGKVDPIPPQWNSRGEKFFDVPPSGTDKADFEISTKR